MIFAFLCRLARAAPFSMCVVRDDHRSSNFYWKKKNTIHACNMKHCTHHMFDCQFVWFFFFLSFARGHTHRSVIFWSLIETRESRAMRNSYNHGCLGKSIVSKVSSRMGNETQNDKFIQKPNPKSAKIQLKMNDRSLCQTSRLSANE